MSIVLYGPPGVGKTEIGKILAKIFLSIGFLSGSSSDNLIVEKKTRPPLDLPPELLALLEIDLSKLPPPPKPSGINKLYEYLGYFIIITIIISTIIGLYDQILKAIDKFGRIKTFLLVLIILGVIYYFCFSGWYGSSDKAPELAKGRPVGDGKTGEKKGPEAELGKNPGTNPQRSPEKLDDYFTVVSRTDFVAEYLGQTGKKTLDLLNTNKKKVIFIDEAYSLYNGREDMYGMEALTVINMFMSENPDTIIIFAGYKEIMMEGIFKKQPGLLRRCLMHLDCEPYDAEDLYYIFLRQIDREGYQLKGKKTRKVTRKLIRENYEYFPYNGGDTARLFTHCKSYHSKRNYRKIFQELANAADHSLQHGEREILYLTITDIEKGIKKLKENHRDVNSDQKDDPLASGRLPRSLETLKELRQGLGIGL
jgi:hypothetical protein